MAITNGHPQCGWCHAVFTPKKPWQKYCSVKCQYTDNNNSKKRGQTNFGRCARCDASLANKKSHALYCSKTCKNMDHTFKHRSKTRVASVARRAELYRRDGGACYICLQPLAIDNFELDHLIPVAKNGSNHQENLAVSCTSCNRARGTRIGIAQYKKLMELRESQN